MKEWRKLEMIRLYFKRYIVLLHLFDKYDKEAFKWLNQTREMFIEDVTSHIMIVKS